MYNKILYILLLLNIISNIESFYNYDRFNNKQIAVNYNKNYVFYTSNLFHSIEYTNKVKNNTINKNNTIVQLRNSSKSLPDIKM